MKNCPLPARPVVAQGCAREPYATSVKAKVIACSSTEIRPRCRTKARRDCKANIRCDGSGTPFARIFGRSGYRQFECGGQKFTPPSRVRKSIGFALHCENAVRCRSVPSRQLSL